MGRKILSGAIVLTILCAVGIVGYSFFTLKNGIKRERSWNHHISIVSYKDWDYGIRNDSTGKIVGRFDDVMPYFEPSDVAATVLVVVKDGLRGYVSAVTGEILFEPQFLYAWIDNAENNLAACVNSEHKLGFVNVNTKEIAIPFQYEFDEDIFIPDEYPKFDFVFHKGICIIPGEDGKLGLIDETGKELLPAEYSDIIDWREDSPIIILERMDDNGIRYGACDREFNMLLPFEYDILYAYDSDGENARYLALKDGKYSLLDDSLKDILPLKVDDFDTAYYSDAFIVEIDGKYGVLDESFNILIPIEYDQIEERYIGEDECLYGYTAVANYTQKLFDSNGALLSDFYVDTIEEYDSTSEEYVEHPGLKAIPELFNQGASPYIMYYFDDCWGVIDGRTREVVVPAKYEKIEYLGNGNFACVLDYKTYLISHKK